MEIMAITNEQLMDASQHINLVKFKTAATEVWNISPVLYSTLEGIELLLTSQGSEQGVRPGEEVIIKFQRAGFEYLISGEVTNMTSGRPSVLSVGYKLAQRYFNQRKHSRFDTDLKVLIKTKGKQSVVSKARNISRGGAMLMTDADLDADSIISINISFQSGNVFKTDAKIMRKFCENSGKYGYGVQFIGITQNNSKVINKEISLYENEYLKSLTVLRDYNKKGEMRFNTRIAIFSYEPEESYNIREELIKLGAENFDVYHNFKYVSEFFSEEKPDTVVIDACNLEQDVVETIHGIADSFREVKVLLLLPMEYAESTRMEKEIPSSVNVLYKPLIRGEFEDGIIKYLL